MKQFIIIAISLAAITGCKKHKIDNDAPQCVQTSIKDFDNNAACNNAKVKQYTFQDKTVYTLDPGTCGADMTTEVIDKNCNTLGYLGGISGNTEINGEKFSKAVYIKTIWKK